MEFSAPTTDLLNIH